MGGVCGGERGGAGLWTETEAGSVGAGAGKRRVNARHAWGCSGMGKGLVGRDARTYSEGLASGGVEA